jgi:hypothetical protein
MVNTPLPPAREWAQIAVAASAEEFPIAHPDRPRQGRRGIQTSPSGAGTRTNPRSGRAESPNESETSRVPWLSGCASATGPGKAGLRAEEAQEIVRREVDIGEDRAYQGHG